MRAMQLPGVGTVSWSCIGVQGPCYFWCHDDWVACAATWGHDGIQTRAAAKDRVWVCGPIAARFCVVVRGPCGHEVLHGGPGSGTQPVTLESGAMLQLGSYRSEGPVPPPGAKGVI